MACDYHSNDSIIAVWWLWFNLIYIISLSLLHQQAGNFFYQTFDFFGMMLFCFQLVTVVFLLQNFSYLVGCLWLMQGSEVRQLSSPTDDAAEGDSSLDTDRSSRYVWVSCDSWCGMWLCVILSLLPGLS